MDSSEEVKLYKAMKGVIKESKQFAWLNTYSEELGRTPSMAISEGNIEDVLNLLNRIGFGIPT